MNRTATMTRRALLALAAKHNATVNEGGGRYYEMTIDAPDGYVWAGEDLHQIVCQQDDFTTRATVYAILAERMASGVERCTDPACETCHSTEWCSAPPASPAQDGAA